MWVLKQKAQMKGALAMCVAIPALEAAVIKEIAGPKAETCGPARNRKLNTYWVRGRATRRWMETLIVAGKAPTKRNGPPLADWKTSYCALRTEDGGKRNSTKSAPISPVAGLGQATLADTQTVQ